MVYEQELDERRVKYCGSTWRGRARFERRCDHDGLCKSQSKLFNYFNL